MWQKKLSKIFLAFLNCGQKVFDTMVAWVKSQNSPSYLQLFTDECVLSYSCQVYPLLTLSSLLNDGSICMSPSCIRSTKKGQNFPPPSFWRVRVVTQKSSKQRSTLWNSSLMKKWFAFWWKNLIGGSEWKLCWLT